MKKILGIVIFSALIVTLCACSAPSVRDISGSRGEEMIVNSLYTEKTDVQALLDELYQVKELKDYLEECEAAVKVEVTEVTEKNIFNVYYTCRIVEDYFENLNYYGMEDGYINVYDSEINYEVGDVAYMFLTGEELKGYKHICYLQLPAVAGYIDTKIVKGKIVPVVEIYSAVSEKNVYGLEKRQDLETEIINYAKDHSKPLVCSELTDDN